MTEASSTQPETRRLGYAPQLDGLRAVAITMVILVHGDVHFPGGWLGVTVFFVLSGFLITSLLTAEQDESGTISFYRFYVRRMLRLTPALVVFLIVALVWAKTHHEYDGAYFRFYMYAVTYRANLYGSVPPGGLGHLWTLATEDQFYLVWPLVLAICLRVGGRRLALVTTVLGAAVSFATSCVLVSHHVSTYRIYHGPDVNAQALLVGCALGLLYTGRSLDRFGESSYVTSAAIFVFVLLILGVFAPDWHTNRWLFTGPVLVYTVLCAFVIAAITLQSRCALAPLLSLSPIVWIGKLSYSLYLWHVWVFFVVHGSGRIQLLVKLVLTMALAVASYYLVEKPGLRVKSRFESSGHARTPVVQLASASMPAVSQVDVNLRRLHLTGLSSTGSGAAPDRKLADGPG